MAGIGGRRNGGRSGGIGGESRRDRTAGGYLARQQMEMWKLALSGTLVICLLLALEGTVCAALRLPIPSLPPGSPWLALLFVLAVGFRLDKEAGGLFGLIAGFLADCAAGSGVMLHPLTWFLMGWFTGLCGRRFLAHNLPSYLIFCGVGGLLECLTRALLYALSGASLPSLPFLWQDVCPDLILSLLFSPLMHLLVRGVYGRGTGGTGRTGSTGSTLGSS